MTLTPETIARLRELHERAPSPVPWVIDHDSDGDACIYDGGISAARVAMSLDPDDAALLVAMRNALPALLDAAERDVSACTHAADVGCELATAKAELKEYAQQYAFQEKQLDVCVADASNAAQRLIALRAENALLRAVKDAARRYFDTPKCERHESAEHMDCDACVRVIRADDAFRDALDAAKGEG